MRTVLLCLAIAACGCGAARRFETADIEHACATHCEEGYERCRSACPTEWGTTLGCTLSTCNPARTQCLDRCGPAYP